MTIESDQLAVGRGQTSRVSSPNVFPASNSSRPNRRLFFDDEDQARNLRDTANSRPQNSGPTTTSEEPDILGQKLIIEELKKKKTYSRLDSDVQALDSTMKSVEHAQRSFLTPNSSDSDNSALRTKGKSKPK